MQSRRHREARTGTVPSRPSAEESNQEPDAGSTRQIRSETLLEHTEPRRAISPLVGVLALLVVTIALAGVIAAVGAGALSVGSTAPTAAFDLAVDGNRSTVTIDHVAGEPVDVETMSMTIVVDGTELESQPPIPFVGSDGFYETPRGPFNAKADPEWRTGTTAGVTVAETNSPTVDSGDTVVVTLAVDGERLAHLETTAV